MEQFSNGIDLVNYLSALSIFHFSNQSEKVATSRIEPSSVDLIKSFDESSNPLGHRRPKMFYPFERSVTFSAIGAPPLEGARSAPVARASGWTCSGRRAQRSRSACGERSERRRGCSGEQEAEERGTSDDASAPEGP